MTAELSAEVIRSLRQLERQAAISARCSRATIAPLEGSGHERLGAFSGATGGCYWCKPYTLLSGMATVTKLGDKYYKIELDPSYANYAYIGYIMFSAQGTGDGVVVTKNEPIE